MHQQVNFEAQREHDFIPNYKQLQLALTASGATQVSHRLLQVLQSTSTMLAQQSQLSQLEQCPNDRFRCERTKANTIHFHIVQNCDVLHCVGLRHSLHLCVEACAAAAAAAAAADAFRLLVGLTATCCHAQHQASICACKFKPVVAACYVNYFRL